MACVPAVTPLSSERHRCCCRRQAQNRRHRSGGPHHWSARPRMPQLHKPNPTLGRHCDMGSEPDAQAASVPASSNNRISSRVFDPNGRCSGGAQHSRHRGCCCTVQPTFTIKARGRTAETSDSSGTCSFNKGREGVAGGVHGVAIIPFRVSGFGRVKTISLLLSVRSPVCGFNCNSTVARSWPALN